MKILVIEDDKRMAEFISKGLTEEGYAGFTLGSTSSELVRRETVGGSLSKDCILLKVFLGHDTTLRLFLPIYLLLLCSLKS